MRKAIFVPALLIIAAVSTVGLTQTRSVSATHNDDVQHVEVEICHSRQPQPSQGGGAGPQNNPYGPKLITVDDDAIFEDSGHDTHDGPVFNNTGQNYWGDIIPPFTTTEGDDYPGLNWTDEGQAIWNNNCQFVDDEETAPDLNWSVVCDFDTLDAVVEVSNMGTAAGDITINGESVTVEPDTTVEKRINTGEEGTQVTIILDNETVYDQFLICVGGRGADETPAQVAQAPAETELPFTAGSGSAIAIAAGSVIALAGVAISAVRRFAVSL